jgi:trigger factor
VKSATETLSPTRVKLTVEIPFEELRPSLDTAYQKIGKQIQVPGFRKGKVPPVVVDQRIGRAAVLDEAVNDALPKMYMQALQDNELKPLGQPEVDVTSFSDGEVLEFTAEVDIRPEITLPDYSALQASVADLAVTDDDVEEQLQGLRERFGTFTDLDRAAAEGDHVTIDLAASENGEPIEGGQVEGQSYEVGKGTMVEGLDEALIGLSAGESATFRSKLVGGDLAGKDVDIQVTVHAVKEQELPELDDEFAQTASEFDTVEEMRADLRERLLRAKRLEQASEARDAVLEVLLEQVEVPLPEGVVAEELQGRRQQITQQLAYAGMTQEQYLETEGQTAEEFDADLERRVRDAITAQFVLDEIATKEQMGVNEAELTEHLVRRAQQAGVSPDEYAKHAMEHDHISSLVSEVVRAKALAHVVEGATVTDASGNEVELARLQPDGTYADPDAAAAVPAEESADAADDTAVEPATSPTA